MTPGHLNLIPGPSRQARSFALLMGATLVLASIPAALLLTAWYANVRPTTFPTVRPATTTFSDSRSGATRCEQCHSFDPLFSHPIGVSPTRAGKNPEALPLESGMITCLTCHTDEQHGAGSGAPGGKMLRQVARGGSLCAQCHDGSIQRAEGAHTVGFGRAHLLGSEIGLRHSENTLGHGLDAESRGCVECHDGMVAGDRGGHTVTGDVGPGTSEHPVGVAYRAGKSDHSKDFALVDPRRLDKRVRLFDRTIGCGSCHSVYSKERSELVFSNVRSQLCLTCHVQQR